MPSLGGALGGAAAGSAIMPGVGTVVGGLIGGLGDLLNPVAQVPKLDPNNPYSQAFADQAKLAQEQAAQQYAAQQAAAGQQGEFVKMLQAQAAGQGPSVSNTLLQQALQQQMAGANAMAASAKGIQNPALVARMAQQQQAQAGQQAAAHGMVGRQQEQLNAQGQLGNALSQQRGQDLQGMLGQQQLAQNYGQMGYGAASGQQGLQFAQNQQQAQANAGLLQGVATAAMPFLLNQGQPASTGLAPQQDQTSNAMMQYATGARKFSEGGYVKGGKVKESGDSEKNDTVHAMLSPGEIVIPRSKAKSPDMAKEFIDHLMKKKGYNPERGDGYGEIVALKKRIEALESQLKKKGK